MKRSRPSLANLLIAVPIIAGFAIYGVMHRPSSGSIPSRVQLSVPYVSQVPDNQWIAPWDEACEEASIVMVDAYYREETTVNQGAAKKIMLDMVAWENGVFKKNTDTDAVQTLKLIQAKSSFLARIKRNPLLSEIKKEIAEGRPVIFLHDMYKLYNEADAGDSYHVSVITGYDDAAGEFIVNDPARPKDRYKYEVLMNSLHDFNPITREADATPTVLFTASP